MRSKSAAHALRLTLPRQQRMRRISQMAPKLTQKAIAKLQDTLALLGRLSFPLALFAYPFYLMSRSPGKEGSHFDPKCNLFTPAEGKLVRSQHAGVCVMQVHSSAHNVGLVWCGCEEGLRRTTRQCQMCSELLAQLQRPSPPGSGWRKLGGWTARRLLANDSTGT